MLIFTVPYRVLRGRITPSSPRRHRGAKRAKRQFSPQLYEQLELDCGYRLDLLVEESVVIEVKSVETLAKIHEAQLLTYLKLSKYRVGLLINFNVKMLKQGIRRIII